MLRRRYTSVYPNVLFDGAANQLKQLLLLPLSKTNAVDGDLAANELQVQRIVPLAAVTFGGAVAAARGVHFDSIRFHFQILVTIHQKSNIY